MSVFHRRRAIDEKRIIAFVEGQNAVSETPTSLANKLHADVRTVRRVLEHLVEAGEMRRRDMGNVEPIYYRYPSLENR
jgi:hypothetical protein